MAQKEVYLVSPEAMDLPNNHAVIEGEEAHHLLKVRRARLNDNIILIDGLGNAWEAIIISMTKKSAECELLKHYPDWCESPVHVHLGLGTLKSDHFMQAVNLSVQAGVKEITPLLCRYSVAKWSDSRSERAERVSLTASKQCGRGFVPPIHKMHHLSDWCIKQEEKRYKFILDQDGGSLPEVEIGSDISLAIGPEGGFNEEEITILKEKGFIPVKLGNRRLRSETAATLAVAMLTVTME
jgi:16S rRNA (uracil1498-N3)-methyltransferase